ncbi:MAG: SUMF1/EgtB/PvdO family nonheme iron enzyme [Elusimicrobia bacterium]|nr:SUMF1/EgtB/PvdO family nonheme iron enzyme [Elusimicrobiota bacterium]
MSATASVPKRPPPPAGCPVCGYVNRAAARLCGVCAMRLVAPEPVEDSAPAFPRVSFAAIASERVTRQLLIVIAGLALLCVLAGVISLALRLRTRHRAIGTNLAAGSDAPVLSLPPGRRAAAPVPLFPAARALPEERGASPKVQAAPPSAAHDARPPVPAPKSQAAPQPARQQPRLAAGVTLMPAPAPGPKTQAAPAAKKERKSPTKITWVAIPGGSFRMGAHHFAQVKTFEIAKHEVTRAQYGACMDAGVCSAAFCQWSAEEDDSHPAVCLTWDQARAFAAWAGGRLPSETEWEYAARGGGAERRFPWGNAAPTCAYAVMRHGDGPGEEGGGEEDDAGQAGDGCGTGATMPVCSKPKGHTEQGLCDMAGNAWEWVQDWYHDSYRGAPADSRAWEDPPGTVRVIRGGAAESRAVELDVMFRAGSGLAEHIRYLGLRPVRDVK